MRTSAESKADFIRHVENIGGKVIGEYVWSNTPIECICPKGHTCFPRPSQTLNGGVNICKICANIKRGNKIVSSETRKAFFSTVKKMGGKVIGEYVNSYTPIECICPMGHSCYPRPTAVVNTKQGICDVCAKINGGATRKFDGKRTKSNASRVIETLNSMGIELLEPYHGSHYVHKIKCKRGHITYTRAHNIIMGERSCSVCAGKFWDIFYIVQSDNGAIKFGITSHDTRPRLGRHKANGYSTVIAIYENLPDGEALEIERGCIRLLASEGIKPIRGREYFPPEALPWIEIVVAYHLAHIGERSRSGKHSGRSPAAPAGPAASPRSRSAPAGPAALAPVVIRLRSVE